jgi:cytoskeletal protein RodZ
MADEKKDFKTHIQEPRWQQIASVIIVLGILGVWLWFALHARH